MLDKKEIEFIEKSLSSIYTKANRIRDQFLDTVDFSHGNFMASFQIPEVKTLLSKAEALSIQLLNETPYELMEYEPYPDYGDFMEIKEFIACCESGGFIDDDGSGELTHEGKCTNMQVIPSQIMSKLLDITRYDGVIWYNK